MRIWSQDPTCQMCGALTDYPGGFEVDHIKPLAQGGSDTDDNLQVLCSGPTGCHAKKTLAEGHNDPSINLFPGWIKPASCDLTIVFGPPGSGKSSYVADRAQFGDTVIDLDVIRSELSGLPLYHGGSAYLRRAIYFRNRLLDSLSTESGRAWFITTGQGKADRHWWVDKLKPAHYVLLDVPEHECIRRVTLDDRRPQEVKDRHIEAIREWWMAERGIASGRSPAAGIGLDGWPR